MKHFETVTHGIDISELHAQLEAQPELWNEHLGRANPDSPHFGVSDIWVRYRAARDLTKPQHFAEPHWAEYYPIWDKLPALKPIVFDLMHKLEATYLGGILVTKIPPGGRVKPHHDRGSWHAETMDTKVYVGVQSNSGCVNFCGDESLVINAGDAVVFNNQIVHSVENNGTTDRITAIICMRRN